MRILVTSGTGTVGGETVRQLREQSIPVSVLTHNPEKAKSMPAGVTGVVGNLRNPESLKPAMDGVDRLFLITPLSETEIDEGTNAVRAAHEAGVRRVVFLSIHDVEKGSHIPHFRSKIEIETALRAAGLPYTLLMPNNFFQNDHWFQRAIMEYGVYPQPIGDIGINRVDIRDIADAAVHALLEDRHEGHRYPLVGPEPLTGGDVAETWSRHMGRPIRYSGNDLEAWGKQAEQMMPQWLIQDLRIMYRFFQEKGLRASEEDFSAQKQILHHHPRDFDTFVAETARIWRSQAA